MQLGNLPKSIGVYAFATSDYLDLDYPLDLWIQWNSKFFDKLAIAAYGPIDVTYPQNVTVKRLETPPESTKFTEFLSNRENLCSALVDDAVESRPRY